MQDWVWAKPEGPGKLHALEDQTLYVIYHYFLSLYLPMVKWEVYQEENGPSCFTDGSAQMWEQGKNQQLHYRLI